MVAARPPPVRSSVPTGAGTLVTHGKARVCARISITLADRPGHYGNCNGPVERVADDERAPYAPDDRPVWRCDRCGQQFWRGSHWDRVAETLAAVRGEDE